MAAFFSGCRCLHLSFNLESFLNLSELKSDVLFMHEKHGWATYTPMARMMRVMGELGEVADEVKNFVHSPECASEEALLFEVYDLAWNLGSLAQLLGIRLTEFSVGGPLSMPRSIGALDGLVTRHLSATFALGRVAVLLGVYEAAGAKAVQSKSASHILDAFGALTQALQSALELVCGIPGLSSTVVDGYFAKKGAFNRARTWS